MGTEIAESTQKIQSNANIEGLEVVPLADVSGDELEPIAYDLAGLLADPKNALLAADRDIVGDLDGDKTNVLRLLTQSQQLFNTEPRMERFIHLDNEDAVGTSSVNLVIPRSPSLDNVQLRQAELKGWSVLEDQERATALGKLAIDKRKEIVDEYYDGLGRTWIRKDNTGMRRTFEEAGFEFSQQAGSKVLYVYDNAPDHIAA